MQFNVVCKYTGYSHSNTSCGSIRYYDHDLDGKHAWCEGADTRAKAKGETARGCATTAVKIYYYLHATTGKLAPYFELIRWW